MGCDLREMAGFTGHNGMQIMVNLFIMGYMALAAIAHRLIAMPKLEGPGVADAAGDFRMGVVRVGGCVDQRIAFERLILDYFESMTRKAKRSNFLGSLRIIYGERTVTLHAGLIFL